MNLDDLFADLPESASGKATAQPPFLFRPLGKRLEEPAARHPDRPAVTDEEGSFTFAELNAHTKALAGRLIRLNLPHESAAAVLAGRNRHYIAAALGILRAGLVYVPLDPALPRRRLRQILDDCAAPVLITDAIHAGEAERLSFFCPSLHTLICPDVPRFEDAVEQTGERMSLELWNHVTSSADGSWKSYFTGEHLSHAVLEAMAQNVLARTACTPATRVLDIGGGSGAVAQALIRNAASYTAVELSRNELQRIQDAGLKYNVPVQTHAMEARDISLLRETYDLIVLNSVVENFPGCNYLRAVLNSAMDRLAAGGLLFVGLIWDSEKQPALHQALYEHAVRNGSSAGLKPFEDGQELSLPRRIFTEWAAQRDDVTVSFSVPDIPSEELREYRYDVCLRKREAGKTDQAYEHGQEEGCGEYNCGKAEPHEHNSEYSTPLNATALPAARRKKEHQAGKLRLGGADIFGSGSSPCSGSMTGSTLLPGNAETSNNTNGSGLAATNIPAPADAASAGAAGKAKVSGPADTTPLPVPGPGDAAYIIYTSGSTGAPKGVLVEHGALMNLTDNLMEQIYAPLPQDLPAHSALLASFAFDASLQYLAALCGGHTLFPVPDELKRDPRLLHQFFKRRDITVCDGTPSLFGLLLDYREHQEHGSPVRTGEAGATGNGSGGSAGHGFPVRTWILGGEPLLLSHLSRLYALPGQENTRVFNAYGPTECCVDSTLYEFTSTTWNKYTSPPLGTALKGIRCFVRDGRGQSVPDGIPGELFIGGAGVARGYLHQPEKTAMAFTEENGMRLYRTGDIVRRQEGLLFYMTREDRQVKTGGYRVEIDEVEAAIQAAPVVARAAVIAGDFSGGDVTSLAAYIVPADATHGALDIPALRAYLANHLPAYALPAYFIPMTSLPMTSSGKIDRKSLPSPLLRAASTPGRAPHSATEKTIAAIWSRLLGRSVTDAEEDFFAVGGHSVLAVRLISLMEQTFGRRLSLTDLFSHTSIAAQAELLEAPQQPEKSSVRIIPLFPAAEKGISSTAAAAEHLFSSAETTSRHIPAPAALPLFLFHPAGGSAFCYKALAEALAPSIAVYAVEPPALLARRPAMLRVEEMAEQYARGIEKQLAALPAGQPFLLGGWSFGGILAFESARQLRGRGLREKNLFLLDSTLSNKYFRDSALMDEAAFLLHLFGQGFPLSLEEFRALSPEERIAVLIRTGKEHGQLPELFDTARMQALVRTFEYNALAAARYTPERLEGKALLLRARQIGSNNSTETADMGWSKVLTGGVDLRWVNGSHETILYAQNVPGIASALLAGLKERD